MVFTSHSRSIYLTNHCQFYRKSWKDRNEEWRPAWTISLPSYPRHAESDPSQDRILILGEDGDLFEIIGLQHRCPPRLEFLLRDDTGYANIAALHGPYLGALDQTGRLAIIDVATGELASPTIQLTHHGKGRFKTGIENNLSDCGCLFMQIPIFWNTLKKVGSW